MGWIDWYQRWFGKPNALAGVFVPDGSPDPSVHGFAAVGSPEELKAPLVWLAEESGSFGLSVLDCRSVTRGHVSIAESGAQLEVFGALRGDTRGEHVRGKRPEPPRTIACHLEYPSIAHLQLGRVFSAPRLEYKWDVVWDGADLAFSRSWTGDVEYRARLVIEASRATVASIECKEQTSSGEETDRLDVLTVDFLIRTYVFSEVALFPIPVGLARTDSTPEENRLTAMLALKRLGCDARFGCSVDDLWNQRMGNPS
jgi:hypothetical protein